MAEQQNFVPSNRSAPRASLFLGSTLRTAVMETPARIRNLSDGGCKVEADIFVTVGDAVQVTLRNIGPVSGRVAWVRHGAIGVTFDVPVQSSRAKKTLAALPPPRGLSEGRRPGFGSFGAASER